ncbi:MAG: nicotinamide-nucleotide amidohydrolase family protein [Myxococcota bacterium]
MASSEILTVGDELLRGDIVDTNAAFLAERLFDLGLSASAILSVGDAQGGLVEALRAAGARTDLLVVSGGLGPTEDDRTAEAAARAAGVSRALDAPSLEAMRARFAHANDRGPKSASASERGAEEVPKRSEAFAMTPNNESQAWLPDGAEALPNPVGTAPGFAMTLGRARAFFLPGVPRELQRMFADEVAPRLTALGLGRRRRMRTLRVFGMGESQIDHRLRDLPLEGVALHYQTRFPENLVKLVCEDEAALARVEALIRERLGDAIYGVDDETMPARVGAALRARGATLAVAESCTGGLLGHLITEVPGSSEYFRFGAVCYANEHKARVLGVSGETLAHEGAVSRACVLEMAEGVRRLGQASFGVAVSGVAGPSGGTPETPVGTVHLAVADEGGRRMAKKLFHPATGPLAREQIKRLAAFGALALLLGACERGFRDE